MTLRDRMTTSTSLPPGSAAHVIEVSCPAGQQAPPPGEDDGLDYINEFKALFDSQLFVHVTTLDFCSLWLLFYGPLVEDMRRRGLTKATILERLAPVKEAMAAKPPPPPPGANLQRLSRHRRRSSIVSRAESLMDLALAEMSVAVEGADDASADARVSAPALSRASSRSARVARSSSCNLLMRLSWFRTCTPAVTTRGIPAGAHTGGRLRMVRRQC